ncbi:MAG: penicillin-binding protein 2 [Candidatus Nomurabacteria bacterium]|jgi:cell division protein FtsI/penicillin-binding protein 2|nr:penicillin-binding protein 2 [Candidatus Nomurabacteria bacterium]
MSGRVRFLVVMMVVGFAVILCKLFSLQIIHHEEYAALADDEQVKRLEIPAKRGLIYLMNGEAVTPIVMNEVVWTLFLDPKEVDDEGAVAKMVEEVVPAPMVSVAEAVADKTSRYQVVAKNLTRKQAEAIKAKGLRGVGLQETTRRVYPEGGLAGQTLGFVNGEAKGQYGAEEAFEERLSGKNGILQTVTDVNSVPLSIGDKNVRVSAQDGENIVLSLDRNIQAAAEKYLAEGLAKSKATWGSVLVMNPNNGRVLAMANNPSYEPEKYMEVEDSKVFSNAILSEPYEAGSVMKTFTMAAGIDTGLATPEMTYLNKYQEVIDGHTVKNATSSLNNQTITFQDAMNHSYNTGMINVLRKLGGGEINSTAKNILYDYFTEKFYFGRVTGIELFETAGVVISPDDAEGSDIRYVNMSFGQGMNVSMVQAAAAFSAVINGGTYYTPTVVQGVLADGKLMENEVRPPRAENVVSKSTSQKMIDVLVKVRKFLRTGKQGGEAAGYLVGGKTGTAETIDEYGAYTEDETIGSYIGFGGANRPEYVIMVRVGGGYHLGGNTDADPIFTELSKYILNYWKIIPKENNND